jgi:hypothetical protein
LQEILVMSKMPAGAAVMQRADTALRAIALTIDL